MADIPSVDFTAIPPAPSSAGSVMGPLMQPFMTSGRDLRTFSQLESQPPWQHERGHDDADRAYENMQHEVRGGGGPVPHPDVPDPPVPVRRLRHPGPGGYEAYRARARQSDIISREDEIGQHIRDHIALTSTSRIEAPPWAYELGRTYPAEHEHRVGDVAELTDAAGGLPPGTTASGTGHEGLPAIRPWAPSFVPAGVRTAILAAGSASYDRMPPTFHPALDTLWANAIERGYAPEPPTHRPRPRLSP